MHEELSLSLRPLGKTELKVSPLCIGCASLGNMPETFSYSVSEKQAKATIQAVFTGRINFVDTPASYGDGESERRLGLVLREMSGRPQGFVLATKADRNLHTGEFSGTQMRLSVERSLRLLGLEQLQLVYLHDPKHILFEQAMDTGGPVEMLQQCQQEGLIAHLGVAGGPIDLMTRFVEKDIFEYASIHRYYQRLPQDLPISGKRVRLRLQRSERRLRSRIAMDPSKDTSTDSSSSNAPCTVVGTLTCCAIASCILHQLLSLCTKAADEPDS